MSAPLIESPGSADDLQRPARRRGGPVLEVSGLTVDYLTANGPVRSCNEVDLTVHEREIVGIAGESGSGKSTLITALTRLQRPPAVTTAGSILYHSPGHDPVELTTMTDGELRRLRWNEIAIVRSEERRVGQEDR